ncbi:MAG: hypothetical protein LDL56_06775 [Armatimonadetes bacterium]|uniref:hypothetical protein n=1 Tax=Elioraea tepidiphila TaxID=457934 RepID=UPI0012EB6E2D|nr:hypothetical protein [Elioraea tepidiphila]MCA1996914.1 hypothetical protein [Armatimonadota bacterium]
MALLEGLGFNPVSRIGPGEGGNRSQLPEGVAELGRDAVDGSLETDRLELLRTEILDDREDELDPIVVGRQPLL